MIKNLTISILAASALCAAVRAGSLDEARSAEAADDYPLAARLYRAAAEKGNAEAQDSLGEFYRNGQGVPKNHREAFKWYRKAAVQGNPYAQNNLGLLYVTGDGVAKNTAEGLRWLRIAAQKGLAVAQCNLADYSCPQWAGQDLAAAVGWYRKAAEHGDRGAQNALGDLYFFQPGRRVGPGRGAQVAPEVRRPGLFPGPERPGQSLLSGRGRPPRPQ